MSREQWGHGYWRGVMDAKNGRVLDDEKTRVLSELAVLHMCRSNLKKEYDSSLFSVKEFIAWCRFCGIQEHWKRIYDYILRNEPFGTYVTGEPNCPPEEDYFCLSMFDAEEIDEAMLEVIGNIGSENCGDQEILWWEDTYEYQRVLEILSTYWLEEKDERFVRVEMYFEHADGQTQEKKIVWRNPNMLESSLPDGRRMSEKQLIDFSKLPPLLSAHQIGTLGELPFKEYVMVKHGKDDDPCGDFARDLARDDHFPIYDYGSVYGNKWHHDHLRGYLLANGICDEAMKAFEKCYLEWEGRYSDTLLYERIRGDKRNIGESVKSSAYTKTCEEAPRLLHETTGQLAQDLQRQEE